MYLSNLDETQRDVSLVNEAHKKRFKVQYDKSFQPHVFNEGDLVLTYDQRYDKLGKGKFKSMWYGPFVISKVLEKQPMSSLIMMESLWGNLAMGCT